jgi:hypothetical protein
MPGINISFVLSFFTDKPNVNDTANASIDSPKAITAISIKPIPFPLMIILQRFLYIVETLFYNVNAYVNNAFCPDPSCVPCAKFSQSERKRYYRIYPHYVLAG